MHKRHWRLKTSAWLVSLALLSWENSIALASQNSNVALTVNQLMRQFTLRNTVGQVNQGLQGHVIESGGKLRGLAMGATPSNFPSDMGAIPSGVGLPNRDGAGRPLGYCAWDNNASSAAGGYLPGSAITNPMVYAVVSAGVNGVMETSCADVNANRTASGDDYLEIRYPLNTASQQFKTAVSTVAGLASVAGSEGDVRLVLENNKLYIYNSGAWVPVSASGLGVFDDDTATNGANAISHTTGKVTVAEFAATAATLSSNLSVAGTSTLTGAVTASNGITVGSGGINVTGASSITGNTTITGDLGVSGAFTAASFSGNGSALTNLNASNIASGTVGAAFGGTGVNASAAANGSLLIGNGSGFSLGTLMGTADQVMVTNGAGSIQISLPQAISATSSPTFSGLVLNGGLTGTTGTFSGNLTANRLLIADSTGGVTRPNVVIGTGAMLGTPSGNGGNTAIGTNALASNTSGSSNTAIGHGSLFNNTTGERNFALGFEAMYVNTTGTGNIAIGESTLRNNTTGSGNIAIGESALRFSTTAVNNIALGQGSMYFNSTGTSNIAIGRDTLFSNTTGSDSVAIGMNALRNSTTANRNSALGYLALENTTTGSSSTAMGYRALGANTTGQNNVALGAAAGFETAGGSSTNANTTGSNNTFLGSYAMPGTTTQLSYATALGSEALVTSNSTVVLGRTSDNTVIGATGTATSGILQNKKLQVTGDVGVSGALALGDALTGTTASFSDNVSYGNQTTIPFARNVPSTVGDTIDIGTFSVPMNGIPLFELNLNSQLSNFAFNKRYVIAGGFNPTGGQWQELIPQNSSGPWVGNDYALDMQTTGSTISFRLRAVSMPFPTLNNVVGHLKVTGAYTSFTASSATGSAGGTPTLLTNSGSLMGVISDKVGIGTAAPTTTLDVVGTGKFSGALTLGGALTGTTASFTGALSALRLNIGDSTGGVTSPNIAIGTGAMSLGTPSGVGANLAIGTNSLINNSTGETNTAVGGETLRSNTTGGYNIAFGERALYSNTITWGNTAIGPYSLYANTGSNNTAVGLGSLEDNTSGERNTGVGQYVMRNTTTGSFNTAMGSEALYQNTTGTTNTAIGYYAMYANTSGSNNTALGFAALDALSSGSDNLVLGKEAGSRNGGYELASGSNNTFLGSYSGRTFAASTLNFATAIGSYAEVGTDNTIVLGRTSDSTVIGATGTATSGILQNKILQVTGDVGVSGALALGGALTGTTASFTGALSALRLNIGDSTGGVTSPNIAIGTGAMLGTPSGAGRNLAVGTSALAANTTGYENIAIGHETMLYNTTGYRNTALGAYAMYSNTTGVQNTGHGFGAIFSNTTGVQNTAIGSEALGSNTTGFQNTAIGTNALILSATGEQNTTLGAFAFDKLVTGNRNLALGVEAGSRDISRELTSGSDNSFVGAYSGPTSGTSTLNYATAIGAYAEVGTDNTIVLGRTSDTTVIGATGTATSGILQNKKLQVTGDIGVSGALALGGTLTGTTASFTGALSALRLNIGDSTGGVTYPNIAIGIGAMSLGAPSDNGANVAIGTNSLTNNSSGGSNTAVGGETLRSNTTGSYNSAFGDAALYSNTTGEDNTAIGTFSLVSNTSGSDNTALGANSLQSNTTGYRNTALGSDSLQLNTTGYRNTAVGDGSLRYNYDGYENTAIGSNSLHDNSSGFRNVAVGLDALASNTTGWQNNAVGRVALTFNTTGFRNNAMGDSALYNNTTGFDNTAMGNLALLMNSTGERNTGIGSYVMRSTTTGGYNTAMGAYTMHQNTTGGNNTAIGYYSMYANTTGAGNTAFGFAALDALTSGSENLVLGFEAGSRSGGYELASGSNNTFLGSYSGRTFAASSLNYATAIGSYAEVGTDNTIVLGRTTDKTVIGATGDDGSGNMLQVTGSVKATAFNTSSDRRLKANINMLGDDLLNSLSSLNAYSYRFISDRTQTTRYGVIAQEIAQLFPNAVSYDARGFMAVDYGALGAIAAAGVGKLNTRLNTLSTKVDKQGEQITALEKDLLKVDDRVKLLEAWKTDTNKRMDTLQTAIDLNIEKIAEHALKIASNTEKITTLEQVTQEHATRLGSAEEGLGKLNAQWASTFAKSEDGNTLTVLTPNLVASNFTAQQIQASSAYTQRLEAEMARIATLEVDQLAARTVRAGELNTGSAQVFASIGSPAFLFAAPADGHYSVNTSAMDGSYATATVIVNGGMAKIIPASNEGIELIAEGNSIKALANGKSIRASWTKTG